MIDKKNRFAGLSGICCAVIYCAVLLVFNKMTLLAGVAIVTAVLILAAEVIVKKEILSDILLVAVDVIAIAVPFAISPTLTGLIWMEIIVGISPLILRRKPALFNGILIVVNVAAATAVLLSGKELGIGVTDYIAIAVAAVWAAIISQKTRTLNEKDRRRHARTIELIEDEKAELATGSMTDPLTGLYNKAYYEMILPKMIASHQQYGLPLTAVFIDIDHFKSINDTFGHSRGDSALIALANALQRHFRKEEIMRFGGEEFLVLIATASFNALKRTEALRQEVERMTTDGIKFTISAGIAEYNDDMADRDLTKAADAQMYRAKNSGRNKICM